MSWFPRADVGRVISLVRLTGCLKIGSLTLSNRFWYVPFGQPVKRNQSKSDLPYATVHWVYIQTCTTWYFIKKRIQNRLFQSQIPSLFFFPSHSLPPFCYNIHFHPHPTGLNPSFSSSLPTDGQLITLSK